jgi:hypothetical protein
MGKVSHGSGSSSPVRSSVHPGQRPELWTRAALLSGPANQQLLPTLPCRPDLRPLFPFGTSFSRGEICQRLALATPLLLQGLISRIRGREEIPYMWGPLVSGRGSEWSGAQRMTCGVCLLVSKKPQLFHQTAFSFLTTHISQQLFFPQLTATTAFLTATAQPNAPLKMSDDH